jgi:hypothetical protein
MGKGSKPRNCFSRQFQDNYESIDWSKPDTDRELIDEGPIINGCGDDQSDECCEFEDNSCANE